MQTKIKKYPWKQTLNNIKTRCTNQNRKEYKDYGGRGIQCRITEKELKYLWFRDKAYNMNYPTIDRKNNDGNYELNNCRYIEKGLNTAERNIRVLSKLILQYDLNDNFIKEWNGIRKASRELNINQSDITQCAKGNSNYSHAGGYKWKYKEHINA